jgi:hypothetical protein
LISGGTITPVASGEWNSTPLPNMNTVMKSLIALM